MNAYPVIARPPVRWRVILPALVLPLAASFLYFVLFPGTEIGNAFYTAVKFFLLAWPAVAVIWILREPLIVRRIPPRHLASLGPGVAFGVATAVALVLLVEFSAWGALVEENADRIAARIKVIGLASLPAYLVFALLISTAHAALEEYFWRWFTFGQLRRLLPFAGAMVIASLGFAAHHVVILSQFFPLGWAFLLGVLVAVGGAFWCWLYHRYGTIVGPWASHMIIDLGLMWVGWRCLA